MGFCLNTTRIDLAIRGFPILKKIHEWELELKLKFKKKISIPIRLNLRDFGNEFKIYHTKFYLQV
jgi:hypothetical protein